MINPNSREIQSLVRMRNKTTQPQLLHCSLTRADKAYTPAWCAKDVVDFFKPSGKILEPAKGEGVFLRFMEAEWCEIEEGRDFFQWTKPMDWIAGNPPYSLWREWMQHSMEIAPVKVPFFVQS